MSQPHPDGLPPITDVEHALRETRRAQAERARIDAARYARELAAHRSLSRGYVLVVMLAAALVALLVRHSRRRPVAPYREVPIDDVERQPRTLRPGYEAPQRW